jgi:hypothetical protein
MRCLSLALVLTASASGIAAAQDPSPPDPMTTTTPTDPAPPDPAPPPPPPPPQPAPAPVVQAAPEHADRPVGLTIGLGLGYGLPTSLETPNRTSARLRLASGLTFEPLLTIANSTSTSEPSTGTETEDKVTELGVAALVRLPLISKGRVDLEALATAGFSNVKTNPDGDFNTRTANTFGIGWGVGIGYWLGPHWQLSMSVTNPLVQYTSTKQQMGSGISDKDSETTIGIIFVPQVVAMIHLYN